FPPAICRIAVCLNSLLNFLLDFIRFSPFNDFQGLTVCLRIGVHSKPVASGAKVDMKFEVIVIPVVDVDRSKAFYSKLGWRLDADFSFDNGFRVVQFTPPGSGCSVQFGMKITTAAPGSAQGLYLIFSDIEAARNDL